MPLRKKFTNRKIRCIHPGCGKFVANASGLTQHMQASHSAARRHAQSPAPGPADGEQIPYEDPMDVDDAFGREAPVGPRLGGARTIYHPLLDGKGILLHLIVLLLMVNIYRYSL
jgi:hypothetical protein